MAPGKFGPFRTRSRDYQEQPSTENLLETNENVEQVVELPDSPIPSTSKGVTEDQASLDLSLLQIDSDDEDASEKGTPTRRLSGFSSVDEACALYEPLKNDLTDCTSTTTLQDYDQIQEYEPGLDLSESASTSCDVLSLQMDVPSCSEPKVQSSKKPWKNKAKEERLLRDIDMWRASNIEVMQNLLAKSGTLDEQIKWEAIATARGLCTLTEGCTCADCTGTKYLAGIADGDGGLGAAPLFNAISVGCQIQ